MERRQGLKLLGATWHGETDESKEAFDHLSMDMFKTEMGGVFYDLCKSVHADGSSMAYKTMEDIFSQIEPTVEIMSMIKPVYNFTASE